MPSSLAPSSPSAVPSVPFVVLGLASSPKDSSYSSRMVRSLTMRITVCLRKKELEKKKGIENTEKGRKEGR